MKILPPNYTGYEDSDGKTGDYNKDDVTHAKPTGQHTTTPAGPGKSPIVVQVNTSAIRSSTYKASPKERHRTIIGVGEQVKLWIDKGSGTTSWKITDGEAYGALDIVKGKRVTLTAGENAGSVTVIANGDTTNPITFNIVEPESWATKRISKVEHQQGTISCGWVGQVYLYPANVNFHNVEARERDSLTTDASGSLLLDKNTDHGATYTVTDDSNGIPVGPWKPCIKHFDESNNDHLSGSVVEGTDHVTGGIVPPQPAGEISIPDATFDHNGPSTQVYYAGTGSYPKFNPGHASFPIIRDWRVSQSVISDSKIKSFSIQSQVITVFADGTCEIDKGLVQASAKYNDDTFIVSGPGDLSEVLPD